jgi:arylsulfatase A-like enzyme
MDLYPTLLSVGGAGITAGPGRDLSDVLRGRNGTAVAPAIALEERLEERDLRAVIIDRQKLIVDVARGQMLSFNLAQDPGELHPLPEPHRPELVAALRDFERVIQTHAGAGEAVQPTQLPESVRQALEALGYGDTVKRP